MDHLPRAVCQERFGHRIGAAIIVDRHEGQVERTRIIVEQHRGQRRVEIVRQQFGLQVGRHDEQPVDAAAHRGDRRGGLVRAAVHVAEQQVHPRFMRDQVDPADDFGKEFAEQVGQDDPDGVSLAPRQAARAAVGNEVQLLDRRHHRGARRCGDIAEPVDRARCRRHRNPRLAGHVPQCRHAAGPLSLIWRRAADATPLLFRRARKRRQRNRLQWRNARSFPHRLQRFAVGVE